MYKLLEILSVSMLVLFGGCSFIDNYPDDNIAEEIVEHLIENETGIDIDLTPSTPEKNDKN